MAHSQHSAAPGSPAIVGPEDRVVRAIASSLSSGASGPTPWRNTPTSNFTSSRTGPVLGGGDVLTVLLGQDHPGRPWPGGHDAPACGPGAPLSTRGPGRWTRTHKAPPAGRQGAAPATYATRLLRALRPRYPCWLPCQVLFWHRGEPARGRQDSTGLPRICLATCVWSGRCVIRRDSRGISTVTATDSGPEPARLR